ncbi:HNH endonuclease signature motif containing protein [Mycobacterium kubicae]|uniref:HNH endonuclease n=1 Tax=Mycobacterium kubicae TaxID=120959 RepID=UPI0013F4F7CD
MNRPCIACGAIISSGSRCDDCRLSSKQPDNSKRHAIRSNPTRWKNLSKRLRRLSPFCELCGATSRLQVDHIIPLGEAEQLGISAYEIANLRVLCRTCTSVDVVSA